MNIIIGLAIGSAALARPSGVPLYAWFTNGKAWTVNNNYVTTRG